PIPRHSTRQGLLDVRVPGQHRHRLAAADGGAGRGTRLSATGRPCGLSRYRQRPELLDAGARMVSDLYPFQGKTLNVQGHRLHCLDEGNGPPVLMLHGNPTWSFYYRNLVLALRGSYRTVVPDHIGCGLSDKPSAECYPYTLERRVED